MHFLIQTFGGHIIHDFAFELIQCQEYYRWRITTEPFDITYHEGLSFDDISNPDIYIPVGTVEFVSAFLKTFYPQAAGALLPLNVPEVLLPFSGRKIVNVETRDDLACFPPGARLFRKSNNAIKDENNGPWIYNPEDSESAVGFQVSEEIEIESEWRLFVFHDQVLHISNYAGDPLIFPGLLDIHRIMKTYNGNTPVAYTLDVGICLDHEKHQVKTVVIECHRFFSCGLYGFCDRNKYPKMLSQTWYQMKNYKNQTSKETVLMMETRKGIKSLMEAYQKDVEKSPHLRSKDELDAKLRWILDRAERYASFCGTVRDNVLMGWESWRHDPWFDYYSESRFPDPDAFKDVSALMYDDWITKGNALFGPDTRFWKFVCPNCGHVQSPWDFAKKKVPSGYAYSNCASRFGIGGEKNCKYTMYGTRKIGGRYVIQKDFIPVRVFGFKEEVPEGNGVFVPGDVVRIRGLEGSPLNGKFGEVVEILEDGMVQVKVADMKLNMPAGITASVTVSPISPKHLIKDAEATLKLRSGGGVIYR